MIMISVVICSRNTVVSADQRSNIGETVGTNMELVAVDNSSDAETIFTAYNKGVARSNGDLMCFVHDDVRFRTSGWGKRIETHFLADERLGMIGFAGAHFMPDVPMYWDASPFISEHNLTTRNGQTEECFFEEHFSGNNLAEVAVADGMCFFVRKRLFDKIAFDEATYQGFHLYDMDISMQVREAGFKVCVCNDVLVEHFYDFDPNKPSFALFDVNLRKFFDKWSERFPLAAGLPGWTEGMTKQLNAYVKQSVQLEESLKNVRQSKAYRLGKAVLHPMKAFRG